MIRTIEWDGCGCIWRENTKTKRKWLIKCNLHRKNPMAFGGILITKEKREE